MVYNSYDNTWYCTHAERLLVTLPDTRFPDTAKVYEVDTKLAYISYGGEWYEA